MSRALAVRDLKPVPASCFQTLLCLFSVCTEAQLKQCVSSLTLPCRLDFCFRAELSQTQFILREEEKKLVLLTHSPRVLEESVVKFSSVAGFAFAVATATSELTASQSLSRGRAGVFRVKAPVHPDDSFWCVRGLGNHFLNGRGCHAVRGRRQEM